MRALLKDQLCRKGACSGRSPPLTPQTVSPTDQCGLPPPYPASPSICRDSNLHPDLDKRVPFNFASGAMEIGQILQKSTAQSVPVKYFGISPPTRTGGAVNPLVQDNNWLEKARQCSHKNLQVRSSELSEVWRVLGHQVSLFCMQEHVAFDNLHWLMMCLSDLDGMVKP
eukprot:jgi/Botrbrau1/12123/Bobra.0186s0041.2